VRKFLAFRLDLVAVVYGNQNQDCTEYERRKGSNDGSKARKNAGRGKRHGNNNGNLNQRKECSEFERQ